MVNAALSLLNLPEYDVEACELSGFLYKDAEGWVLSAQPHLKSCCVHKLPFLRLKGELPLLTEDNHKIFLTGHLKKEAGLWILQDPKPLIQKNSSIALYSLFFTVMILLIAYLTYRTYKKSKR